MTWIKLDDKAPRHHKVASLSDRSFRWWVKGLCYASEFLTNGVLHPIFWREVPKQSRAELTGNRLWDWDDPNFIIHDYLKHQTSKETVFLKKSESAERVARYRERKRNSVTDVTGNSVTSVTGNANVTLPDTETDTETDTDTEKTDRFARWWAEYPRKTGKGAAEKAWSKIDITDALFEQMLSALKWQRTQPRWVKDGGEYIPHPSTYLNQRRWEDEPFFTSPEPVAVSAVQSRHEQMLADIDAGVYRG